LAGNQDNVSYTKVPYQTTLSAFLGNDLKHVPVTSDGNCFDTTFLKSVKMETDIQRLRKNA
jgi:DNA mismatch repair protein MutH